MYLFKNAWKNLFRNKGRNLLIFLVFLLMVTGGTTCAIIRAATQQKIVDAQQTLPIKVTSDLNFMKVQEDSEYREEKLIDGTVRIRRISEPILDISIDQMKAIVTSPLLDRSVVSFGAPVYSPTLQFVDNGNALDAELDQYYGTDKQTLYQLVEKIYKLKYDYYASDAFKTSSLFLTLYGEGHQLTEDEIRELSARTVFGDTLYQQYMNDQTLNDDLVNEALGIYYDDEGDIIGNLTSNYPSRAGLYAYSGENTDFSGGANVITEGRMPEKDNECAIGSQFAALNNLTVGSKVTLQSLKIADTRPIELTVCGIYKEVAWEATHNIFQAPDPNNLYVAPEMFYNTKLDGAWAMDIGAEFYLKSADDVEEFQDLMRANGYNQYFTLQSNLEAREKALEPLREVSKLMNTILIAVLALGGAIFLLLTFFAVRERKYEIGVLRAIGMKKKAVIMGFLYETLIVVLICCVLGMVAGTFASQPMLNLMMNAQAEAETPAASNEPRTEAMPGAADGAATNDAAEPANDATTGSTADAETAPTGAGASEEMMGGSEILTMDENGNFVDQNGNPVSGEGMMMGDPTAANEGTPDASATAAEDTPEYSYEGPEFSVVYSDEDGNMIPMESQEKLEIGDVSAYLTWQTVALILGVALLLAALAVIIAGSYITKFEPIKILSEQE